MNLTRHWPQLSACFVALAMWSCGSPEDSTDTNPGSGGKGGTSPATGGKGGTSPGSGGSTGGTAPGTGGGDTGGSGGGDSGGTSSAGSDGSGGSAVGGDTSVGGGSAGTGNTVTKPTCGGGKAKVPTDGSTEGVVIAPDGTIYHSQSFSGEYISRIRPGMDQETSWVKVGPTVLGITYDPKRKAIYAGSRGRKKILKIVVDKDTPDVVEFADAEAGVNGVTLGEDDAVYYNDQTSGHISRVAPDGKKTRVTPDDSPVAGGPNGLAFGPDGWLYVNLWDGKEIVRLKLDANGKQEKRETFAPVAFNHADGIAFDEMGKLYITAGGKLNVFGTDGKFIRAMASNGANLDFGTGALSCSDVYVGGNGGGLKVHTLDTKGMNVPWHRPAP